MRLSRFTLVLVTVALILAGLGVWFWQKNTYSTELLKLELLAPKQSVMGEEMTYTVKYKNNGDSRLEKALLIFEYPSGSIPSTGTNGRVTSTLEDIYPGQEQNIAFKARLFGKEGEMKEAKEVPMKGKGDVVRRAMKGKCPNCGTAMFRILGNKK